MVMLNPSFVLGLLYFTTSTTASSGDTSNEFIGCYHTCHFNNCSSENSLRIFQENQDNFNQLLKWSCDDECKYECMWHTTNVHMKRGWRVPQFYGKWPFSRVIGLQEPASVLFSFFNFFAQLYNFRKFKDRVPKDAPFVMIWTVYYLVCLNAWLWSMVFHARDNSFTEQLDYFSAFAMVLFSLLVLLFRLCGKEKLWLKTAVASGFLFFFLYHLIYLATKSFDYGYNMRINVAIGILNGFGWLLWSWSRSDERTYLYWCQVTVVAAGATMFLELLDFPPIWWTFDAHALWHLSTCILPFYWYKFIKGDCLYLLQKWTPSKKVV